MCEKANELKKNLASSGTAEEYGEREKLLDTIIEEIDSKDEQEHTEKQERQARELIIQKSSDNVRSMTLKRMSRNNGDEDKASTPKKQKRRAIVFNLHYEGADEEMKLMREQDAIRRKQEDRML